MRRSGRKRTNTDSTRSVTAKNRPGERVLRALKWHAEQVGRDRDAIVAHSPMSGHQAGRQDTVIVDLRRGHERSREQQRTGQAAPTPKRPERVIPLVPVTTHS